MRGEQVVEVVVVQHLHGASALGLLLVVPPPEVPHGSAASYAAWYLYVPTSPACTMGIWYILHEKSQRPHTVASYPGGTYQLLAPSERAP